MPKADVMNFGFRIKTSTHKYSIAVSEAHMFMIMMIARGFKISVLEFLDDPIFKSEDLEVE